jgi:uncharacterized protein (TIGR02444 family)
VYGAKGVQQECLALQDRGGVDINLVLLMAYLGVRHEAVLSAPDVADAVAVVHVWSTDIVGGLRSLRREFRQHLDSANESQAAQIQPLYAQLKATELAAEKSEQRMLAEWADHHLDDWSRGEAAHALTSNVTTLLGLYPDCRLGISDIPCLLQAASSFRET